MSANYKSAVRRLTQIPLHIVTTPYRHWLERRQLSIEIKETQRTIAEETDDQIADFHNELWSNWPDVVQKVREQIQTERREKR